MNSMTDASSELLSAVRAYTRFKVLDGIVPLAGGEDVENPLAAARAASAVRAAGGPVQLFASLEWSPLLYCYFRRWMTAAGNEAEVGELRDARSGLRTKR